MSGIVFRALIVDTDPTTRRHATMALSEDGFVCEHADDGQEALERVRTRGFDVVITDLLLPKLNGHALLVALLELKDRPALVAYTSLTHPRLIDDLRARGVDDVLSKATEYQALAQKVRHYAELRRSKPAPQAETRKEPPPPTQPFLPVDVGELEEQLNKVATLQPLSTAAFEVYKLSTQPDTDVQLLAAVVHREPALAVEVLRLANSSKYNWQTRRITNLEEAIARIGQRCLGEKSLAMNALSVLAKRKLPWMSVETSWKRCLAAGVALEYLLELKPAPCPTEGLMLSALLHPMGRCLLGSIYPAAYQAALAKCGEQASELDAWERRVFPLGTGGALSYVLKRWGLSDEITDPVFFLPKSYAQLSQLREPLRSQVELLKVAVFLAHLAIANWEPWETIEPPSRELLSRLGIDQLAKILSDIRAATDSVEVYSSSAASERAAATRPSRAQDQCVSYWSPRSSGQDVFPELLSACGFIVKSYDGRQRVSAPVVCNWLDVPPDAVMTQGPHLAPSDILPVIRAVSSTRLPVLAHKLVFPASVAALRTTCGAAVLPSQDNTALN